MENNNVINAVKRLERAGSENSRATQKLFEAASKVAGLVEKMAPDSVKLPRGYKVIYASANIGGCHFLIRGDEEEENADFIDGIGEYLYGDFNCFIPNQTRRSVLKFAEDIAGGWLDEVAAFLEERAKKSDENSETLDSANLK
jgi:hypothetical protein